jgi:hypothetical protein
MTKTVPFAPGYKLKGVGNNLNKLNPNTNTNTNKIKENTLKH